jgi:predicted PurR-regulated permease PerM
MPATGSGFLSLIDHREKQAVGAGHAHDFLNPLIHSLEVSNAPCLNIARPIRGESEMSEHNPSSEDQSFIRIQIGLIFLLAAWCIRIISPFIGIVAWAAIIAIAVYPLHRKLMGALGGREKLSVMIIVLIGLSVLLVPTWTLTGSSIDTAQQLATGLEEGTLRVPPPGDKVAEWPIVGNQIHTVWSEAAANLEATLKKHSDQVKAFSSWLFSAVTGTAMGILAFAFSIIIAGVLMLSAEKSYQAFRGIGHRLGGDRGADFTDLCTATVRSVAKGVLGVALIQTLLAAIGLIVMDIPAAGIWSAIILLLAIMQLPPLLVLLPIAIWVFSTAEPVPATIFLVYALLVSFSDAVLKPLLLGRGVDVPMLVILLGAIGGMITSGIIGLFIGAVILALGYQLFTYWLNRDSSEEIEEGSGE